jgi:hypothetical protein
VRDVTDCTVRLILKKDTPTAMRAHSSGRVL